MKKLLQWSAKYVFHKTVGDWNSSIFCLIFDIALLNIFYFLFYVSITIQFKCIIPDDLSGKPKTLSYLPHWNSLGHLLLLMTQYCLKALSPWFLHHFISLCVKFFLIQSLSIYSFLILCPYKLVFISSLIFLHFTSSTLTLETDS